MGNNGFLVGILVACCLLLLAATGFTWFEMQRYGPAITSVEPVAALPPEEGPAEAEAAEVLDLAPENTLAVIQIDVATLRDSGLLEKAKAMPGADKAAAGPLDPEQLPFKPEQLEKVTLYVVPDPADLESPPEFAGVMLHSALISDVEQALQDQSLDVQDMEGLQAYEMPDGYAALAGEDMLLFGSTPEILAQVIKAQKSGKGALPPALKEAAGKYASFTVNFAALLTDAVKEQAGDMAAGTPPYLLKINQAAGGIKIGDEALELVCTAVFSDAESAQQAAEDANKKIQELKTKLGEQVKMMASSGGGGEMEQTMKSILALFDTIKVSADGAEFQFSVRLTLKQIEDAAKGLLGVMMSGFAPAAMGQ